MWNPAAERIFDWSEGEVVGRLPNIPEEKAEEYWEMLPDVLAGAEITVSMSVTAEGVETREQFDLLREMGCEATQGYFMSRPVPAEEAARLLDSGLRW